MPLVKAGRARSNAAFSDTGNTVLIIGANLANAMPVDGGGIASQAIRDQNLDHVTPVGNNGFARRLAVDGESRSRSSIKIDVFLSDHQAVCLRLSSKEDIVGVVVNRFASAPHAAVLFCIA